MNGRNAIFRLFCLICLSLLMAACKKDDEGGNRSPIFDADAAIAAQTYTQNVEITALTLPEATGGDGTLTYTLSPSLPQGLTFDDAQRTITGTPQDGLPQTTFTYTVTDEDGDTAELTFAVTVNAVPAFANDAAIAGQMYTQNVEIADLTLPQAMGGDGALSYTLSPNPPMGLTFDAAQRTLTGTPVAAQDETEYTYTAADEDNDEVSLTFTITVGSVLAFASDAVIADQAYTRNVMIPDLKLPQAMGGDGALTYTLSPSLPQGLTFDPAQRILTGTPQSNMRKTTYTYTVTDEAGNTAALTFTLIVGTAPAFASGAAIAEQTYIQNEPIADLTLPQVTGGDGALTYTLSPALPRGLTFDATQRTITGTPEVMQTATEYTYTVTDEDGDAAALTFMLTVEEDLMPAFANDASVPPQLYTETKAIADLTLPQATGGNGDLTYTLTKNDGTKLPDGLTFDAMMRVLAGRPATGTAAGATDYTLTATDRDGDTATLTFMITIVANEVPAFAEGASVVPQVYTETKAFTNLMLQEATGGNGDLTYSLTKSDGTALPAGLTFNATTRVLSGMPATGTAASAADYTLTATDRDGDTDELTFSITIRAASDMPITLSAATLTVQGIEGTDNTIMLTSSVAWEATETLEWITMVVPASGSASATAQAITLSYSVNAGSERMGTVTFTETTAGASPKFSVTLTVTQPTRPDPIVVSATEISVGPAATEVVITFTSSVDWQGSQPAGDPVRLSGGSTARTGLASATAQTITQTFGVNTGSTTARVFRYDIREVASPNFTVRVTVTQRGRVADGMIPINNLEQLHAMRYDLTGDGQVDHAGDEDNMTDSGTAYAAAFPDVVYASGRYTGYMLIRDLNFRSAGSYASGTVNTDWTEAGGGSGWLPVGVFSNDGDGTNDAAFSGTFDGGGFAIDSLVINRTGNDLYLGLFAYVTGTIINTGITNAKVTGGTDSTVGGLAGIQLGGTISECYASSVAITGSARGSANDYGGLVGATNSTISGCYVSGVSITGTVQYPGGLVGNSNGTISSCYVSGASITASISGGGGLVGRQSNGIISGCYTSGGSITNTSSFTLNDIGGLVGLQQAGTLSGCYVNNTAISAAGRMGSLVGNQLGTLTACYAGGRIYPNLRGAGSGAINYSYYEAASEPNSGDDAKATVQAKTKAALITPTAYGSSGIFADWDNIDIDGDGTKDTEDTNDFWDFGTDKEYPILKGVGGTQR